MSLSKAVAFIRRREGGAYHPTHGSYDPNPTMWGITQDTYNGAGYPGSVYDITEDQWTAIFVARFWRKAGCHLWPEPLDLVVADPAFNSGPKQALKFLQRGTNATPDGVFGPQTVALVQTATQTPKGVLDLCVRVQGQRIRFLKDLYQKSLDKQKAWDACPPDQRATQFPNDPDRPKLAPISNWLDRVADLGRTIGLH